MDQKKRPITEEEIMSKRTPKGGWTKDQFAEWGISWPPPPGWKEEIIDHGIPYSEVIEAFGGGNVVAEDKPLFCAHCDRGLIPEYKRLYPRGSVKELVALLEKRHGEIVESVWPNGRCKWICSYCGREAE